MNDFERKLRQQPFRAPPPDVRFQLFGAPPPLIRPAPEARWTWRDWFWPSPAAWGALAALWLVFAALSLGNRPASGGFTSTPTSPPELNATLLSYHTTSNLNHALELAN